jgi:hypothetical protein
MYAPLGGCTGQVCAQPLDWSSLVLVCGGHLPDLRALRRDLAETRRIKRYLSNKFQAA